MAPFGSFLSQVKAAALERLAARRQDLRFDSPICSITFDDVPRSAFLNGVPLLRQYHASATFYVAAGLSADDGYLARDEIRALDADGFDVACHTYSHYRLKTGTSQGLAGDASRNRLAFHQALGLRPPRDFSYPFGQVTPAAKRGIGRDYATARSVYAGVNGAGTDLLLLRANLIVADSDRRVMDALIARAVRERGWVIFLTHAVEDHPDPWSCRPEDLGRLLEACQRAGLMMRSVRSVSEEILPSFVPTEPTPPSR